MSIPWQRAPSKPTELTPYDGPESFLTPEDLRYFRDRFEIQPCHEHLKRGKWNRFVLPILSPAGERRGIVLRQPWGQVAYGNGKKACTFVEKLEPLQSWYHRSPAVPAVWHAALVLVEDQLSAIKLWTFGVSAVALLGVPSGGELGADRVREIAQYANPRNLEVIVALDADATETAIQFVRRWGMAFKKIRVAILEKDIKNTPMAEIAGVLGL